MSFDVLIIDLNMKALNSLIWCSAVLAKIVIVTAGIMLILYLGAFIVGLREGL